LTTIGFDSHVEQQAPGRLGALRTKAGGALGRLSWFERISLVVVVIVGTVALLGPLFAPYDPVARMADPFLGPGGTHWLGTDESGRDILSRLLYGMRSTWVSVIVVLVVTGTIGAVVGTIAGTAGGWIDNVLMRVDDLLLSLPGPLIAIAVVAALGPSLTNTLIGVALVWWPWYARIVRNEVRSIGARPHVEAARLRGSSGWRLGRRHLFPGALPPLLVTISLDVATLILTLTALSFLGLGAPPPEPELGSMLASSVSYVLVHPFIPIVISVAVTLLALAGNLLGDLMQAGRER